MMHVPEQQLSEAPSYAALQAARTTFQEAAAGSMEKQTAHEGLITALRTCLVEIGSPMADYLPADAE
jgi:hypothetical protein